jgi:hypothetical protein
MKRIFALAAIAALFAGCASQGGMGGTANPSETTAAVDPTPGVDTTLLHFRSPGNDRNDTGTSSGTGVSDLGAASPSDQLQREPYDPRWHWTY